MGQGWEREGSREERGEAQRRARRGGVSTGSLDKVGGRPGPRESWRPRPCFREARPLCSMLLRRGEMTLGPASSDEGPSAGVAET